MIEQYHFVVTPAEGQALSSALGYPLYAWLLEQLPQELGELLHGQDALTPSQYLCYDHARRQYLWRVTLPSEDLIAPLRPVLEDLHTVPLHTGTLSVALENITRYEGGEALLREARQTEAPARRTELCFLTTTTFKQDGRYVLFPQVRLILQSLIRKWSGLCHDWSLADEDAFRLLEQGLMITDYRLHASRYPLKGSRIAGFAGTLEITSRLSPPMEELWQLLLRVAPLTGVGVKTALGMGGVTVRTQRAELAP